MRFYHPLYLKHGVKNGYDQISFEILVIKCNFSLESITENQELLHYMTQDFSVWHFSTFLCPDKKCPTDKTGESQI